MKDRELLPAEGIFYKGNLHSHTTVSDGKLTPEESKKAYKERGYQILAFTDHEGYRNHQELDDGEFITLPALEVSLNEGSRDRLLPEDKTYHINLYDTRPRRRTDEELADLLPRVSYQDRDGLNDYLYRMKESGFLACYNHPYWSMQTFEDYKDLRHLWGMEIYNHGCELDGMYGYHPQAYDEMLRRGMKITCLATDDNHNQYPFEDPLCDSFGGFTMIKALRLTHGAVIEALERGDFYSSMGPEFYSLYIEGDELVVVTSPVTRIYVMTAGRNCPQKTARPGETICSARFPLNGKEGYIRVQIQDDNKRYANTNAYFLEED